jgi:VWFA-related protein
MGVLLRILAAAALLLGGFYLRQENPASQKPLQYELTVSLKLIQVYVTDKNGQPVTDLKKEDFAVFADGRPVEITDFETHAVGPQAAVDVEPLPPEKTVETAAPASRTINRKFFLFFDFAFNNPRGLLKAREAALHFLDSQIMPVDELGLVSYSALKGLVVHEYLTTDHGKVRAAVEAIGTKALTGRAEDFEEEYWRQAGEAVGTGRFPTAREAQAESKRFESKYQAEHYIQNITGLAKALRYVAGQKQVVFFSTGIPSSMIYGHQAGRAGETDSSGQVLSRSKFDPGDVDLRSQNEVMYKEFSASNCTLYAFDTREAAKVASGFNYDEQTLLTGYRDMFTEQGVHSESTAAFRNEKLTGRDALERFSEITGGKYFGNINEFQKSTGEVGNLTGTYYVLGHYVTEQPDGKFHELKVEVKRPGCRVRAQTGYFSPKPFRESTSLERQLHLLDLALNGRSAFGAPVTMAVTNLSCPASAGATRVQLLTKITAEVMAKLSTGKLEFFSVIFDGRNDIVSFQKSQASLSDYRESDVLITSGAELKTGSYKCRVIVRNLETGMTALASAMVDVPGDEPAGPALRAPLLLLRDLPPVYVSTEPAPQRDAPAWKELYLFDQARFAPVIGQLAPGVSRIYAVVPYFFPGPGGGEPSWTARLLRAGSGERVPLVVSPLTSFENGGLRVQFLELSLDGLLPGDYELYFRAEDGASGASAEVHTPLKIVI